MHNKISRTTNRWYKFHISKGENSEQKEIYIGIDIQIKQNRTESPKIYSYIKIVLMVTEHCDYTKNY